MPQAEQLLQERYRLQQQLGHNAARQTWLGQDTRTSPPTPVVIKFLAFSPQMQWEELKLFEREAQVLKSLDLPHIPRCRDYFSLETEAEEGLCWFVLIQDYIPGKSLQQLLDEGDRFKEEQVRAIAVQILHILRDLHHLEPPVLHRDIKPSNLILSNFSAPDSRDRENSSNSLDKGRFNQIYLIDFGAVSDTTTTEGATFTVVGTAGYAPLEQFWGKAVPASDLYALGATLIHLLTGVPPSELPQQNLRVEFRRLVNLNSTFLRWLETLTDPDLNRRFRSATQALEALETGENLPKLAQPPGSRARVWKSRDRLHIKTPRKARSLAERTKLGFAIFKELFLSLFSRSFFFAPFVIGFFLILTVLLQVLAGELLPIALIIPVLLLSFLMWSWKRNKKELRNILLDFYLFIEQKLSFSEIIFYCYFENRVNFYLIHPARFFGFGVGRKVRRSVTAIQNIEFVPGKGIALEIDPGAIPSLDTSTEFPEGKIGSYSKRFFLGDGLSLTESDWLIEEIEDWLAKYKSGDDLNAAERDGERANHQREDWIEDI